MINVIIVAGKKTPLRKKKTFIFCSLDLNKLSPNVASRIRHELRRLSLKLQIAINIFKFWSLLENQRPNFA